MKRNIAVLCIVFLVSAYGTVQAKILDTLVIEGLQINPPSIVRNTVGLTKGQSFEAVAIQEAITGLYELGIFRSVDFYVDAETDSSVSLTLAVQEFPVCEDVEFAGYKKLGKGDLEEKVTIKRGQVVSDALLAVNRGILKKIYADKGYLLASIKTDLVPSKIPGNTTVKFVINEGVKVQIKKITFQGNTVFKEDKLKWEFKTKEKAWWRSGDYDETIYRNQLDTLMQWYNDQGYLDAEVVRDSIWYGTTQKDLFIAITIKEGKKFFAGNFFFSGNVILADTLLQGQVALKKGQSFQKSKFDQTTSFVENRYREEGFLWVQVRESRVYRGDTIDITYSINEGKPAIIRKIDISGNTKTSDLVIRRELRLYPGKKYKQSLVARSYRDVQMLNFFGSVNVVPKPIDETSGIIDVAFEVTEKENIGQLQVGASYSQLGSFMGTFSIGIPNFRGLGEDLNLSLEGGAERQNALISFTEPWAFNTPTRVSLNAHFKHEDYQNYTNDERYNYGFGIGAGRGLKWPDDYFRIDGYYVIDWVEEISSARIDTVNHFVVRPSGLLSQLSFILQRNDCDLPEFPTYGSKFVFTPEIAGLGGDYRFFRGTVSYDWYFPLFANLVLGAKSKLGLITSFDNSPAVVSSKDMYRVGGVWINPPWNGVLRGYRESSIGGYPNNGTAMLGLGLELRYPILENQIYIAAFLDRANTWSDVSKVDLSDMKMGTGLGLRILVPMLGLMGIDLGWPLVDPKQANPFSIDLKETPEVHFMIGKGF